MKRLPLIFLVGAAAWLAATPLQAWSGNLFGFIAAGAESTNAPNSWLGGGFGRLSAGSGSQAHSTATAFAESRLGLRLEATTAWSFFAHVAARAEPGSQAASAGVIEAFAQWRHALGDTSEARVRFGTFFLPTSRENVDPLWSSRYTLTLSALNSWIGEEIRPTGVDVAVRAGEHTSFAATAFGGNDAAGALLAWRGWSFGQRVTAFGEALPLPPLASLNDPRAFAEQRRDGTEPLGRDLDGRLGWAARTRAEWPGILVQASAYDNRGDRGLHAHEYAWRTETHQLAVELEGAGWTLIAEGLRGTSGMGVLTRPHVDVDLWAAYVLLSRASGPWRLSARWDRFALVDRDHSAAENNDEYGWGATVALFWQPREHWRLGVEALRARGQRDAARASGVAEETGGDSLRLELRASF